LDMSVDGCGNGVVGLSLSLSLSVGKKSLPDFTNLVLQHGKAKNFISLPKKSKSTWLKA
jgi:hypothetical protein